MQTTIQSEITVQGVGLHSGASITMTLKPADADTGVVFIRTDWNTKQNRIPALYSHVVDTKLCTVIGNHDGASVGTIEHLMSALRGMNIDNVEIELGGPEVPIMDGSAMPFVAAIEEAGIETLDAPRKVIRILRDVVYEQDGKRVSLSPGEQSVFSGVIDFDDDVIGKQEYSVSLLNGNFVHDIAMARTFCFEKDVEFMRSHNLALGGSLENAIVVNDTGVLNNEGLRYADEFIRHKILDGIGDLALAGAPILGEYFGYKLGHDANYKLLEALFADPRNYRIEYTHVGGAEKTAAPTQSDPAYL